MANYDRFVYIDIVTGELYQTVARISIDNDACTVVKFTDEEGNSRYCMEDEWIARTRPARPVWKYGMRHRPFSIGSQPKGVYRVESDPNGHYWDIIVYEHPLQSKDVADYELDELGKEYV